MADRSIIIKLGVAGAKQATTELENFGTKGERSLGRIEKAASLGANAMRLLGPVVGTLSAGALVAFTKNIIDTVGGLGELAEQVGVSTTALQTLQYQAIQSGVGAEQMEAAVSKLTRTIGDAAAGSDEAIGAFKSLNVGILDSNGNIRKTEEVLQDVAVAIGNLPTEAERAKAAFDIFGKSGQRFQTVLSEIAKQGLGGLETAAREAGVVIEDDLIKRFDEVSDRAAVAGKQFTVFAADVIDAIGRIGAKSAEGYANLFKFMGLVKTADPTKRLKEIEGEEAGILDELYKAQTTTRITNPDIKQAQVNLIKQRLKNLQDERDKLLQTIKEAQQPPKVEVPATDRTLPKGTAEAEREKRERERLEREEAAAAAKAARERASAMQQLANETDNLRSRLEPTYAATLRFNKGVETLDAALAAGKITTEEYARLVGELQKELEGLETSEQKVNRQRKEAEQILKDLQPAIEAYGDELERIAELEEAGELSAVKAEQARERAREKLRTQTEEAADDTEDLAELAGDLGLQFVSAFEDAIVEGKKFSDVLKGLAQDIARLLIRRTVTEPLLGALSGALKGIDLGGIFGSKGDPVWGGNNPGSIIFGEFPFARGGVMTPRGPAELNSYASGGIADRPQIALFGEGSMNEAYVPLPDGRSIPVSMRGGGGMTFNIDARGADAGVEGRIYKVLEREVPNIIKMASADVERQANRGGSFSRSVGRRGG